MARYIDVDKITIPKGFFDDLNVPKFLAWLKAQPTADVAPKSYGKWKPYKDYFTHRQVGWICTNCSVVIRDLSNGDTNYCPYCGAIMETECEEEDE